MEFLKEVLLELSKKSIKFINNCCFALLFIFVVGILPKNIEYSTLVIVILLFGIIYILTRIFVIKYMSKNFNFNNTKLYKLIEKMGYTEEFFNTINSEIESDKAIKYYNSSYKSGLIITKTWIIFLNQYPEIRKTVNIHKITEEFRTIDSKFYFVVEFTDENKITTKEIKYDELEEEIKKKYPEINIGRNNNEVI